MTGAKSTNKKKKNAGKNKVVDEPKRPKRPASALCAFATEFGNREINKKSRTIYEDCWKEWAKMSDEDKKKYYTNAKRRMTVYQKALAVYNEKMKSNVQNDENGEDGNGQEEP